MRVIVYLVMVVYISLAMELCMVVIGGEALHAVNVRWQIEHFLLDSVAFLVRVVLDNPASNIYLDRAARLAHGSVEQLVLVSLSQHVESLVLVGCEYRLIVRCIMKALLI